MFAVCGVPADKFKSVCSTIDKLDNQPWNEIRNELIYERLLETATFDRIHDYVMLRSLNPQLSSDALVELLLRDERLASNKDAKTALDGLRLLLRYVDLFGVGKSKRASRASQAELIYERLLEIAAVDRIHDYVMLRSLNPQLSSDALVELLLRDERLASNKDAKTALEGLRLLLRYVELFGVGKKVVFEPSLARGLDYYTGAIYEAVITEYAHMMGTTTTPPAAVPVTLLDGADEVDEQAGVGSVAGGGRYDNLVGMFDSKGRNVPCCGVSLGIERIFSIMELKLKAEEEVVRTNETEVFVASAQKKLHEERMKLCTELWDAGLKAELSYKANPKLLDQLQYCEDRRIPLAIIVGESELQNGVVKIRNVATRDEKNCPRASLVDTLREELRKFAKGAGATTS